MKEEASIYIPYNCAARPSACVAEVLQSALNVSDEKHSGDGSDSGRSAPRTAVRESQARRLGRVAEEEAADYRENRRKTAGGGRGARASEGGRRREGGERRARPRMPSGLELASVAAPRARAHSQLSHDCSGVCPRPKGKALNQ